MTAMEPRSLQVPPSGGLVRIEAVEAASELESFVYIVSHDLRNCARALSEVPQWLQDDLRAQGVEFAPDVEENFDLLNRHAKRLDRMLLDLLVYSRVGRMQQVTEFSLADVLEDVIGEIVVPDRITLAVDEPLPKLRMGYNDAFVLVKSIIDNVIRHCPGDRVTLTISAKRRQGEVAITFTDDGPGIQHGDLQRVFRPMTTLVRRDEVEGSGMGLAIVHRIVANYGGEVAAGPGPTGDGLRLRVRLRDGEVTGAPSVTVGPDVQG